jgi:hypothetical protein
MRTHYQVLAGAGCVLSLMASTFAAQSFAAQADAQQPRKTVIAVETSRRPVDPLDTRVSFQFTNSPAGDVIRVLTKAAGLQVDVPSTALLPVTLTLSNIRLRVALDAICDTAACGWRLEGATIRISPAEDNQGSGLPPTVSIALKDVAVPDVFRALGSALGIAVRIDGQVNRPPATVNFTSADTRTVLTFLCQSAGCTWQFDDAARELRIRFNAR